MAAGAAFAVQVVNVGTEAGGRTATITYSSTVDKVNAPFVTPTGASAIATDYACDGAADTTQLWSFSPKPCEAMKIIVTLSGALTNGLDVYLMIW